MVYKSLLFNSCTHTRSLQSTNNFKLSNNDYGQSAGGEGLFN